MALTQNVRRDVPNSADAADPMKVALGVLRNNVEDAVRASLRGLPPGFRFGVERLADGRARLLIIDATRADSSLVIGEW